VPSKITATDTGKPGPGAQTIKGGNVTLTLSVDSKPLSCIRENSTNLFNTKEMSHLYAHRFGAATKPSNELTSNYMGENLDQPESSDIETRSATGIAVFGIMLEAASDEH